MKRLLYSLLLVLIPLTLSAQKLTIGPAPTRPTVNGTFNISRNSATGLFELTPFTGSPFVMPVDTLQIKGWAGVKGLFKPYNWFPAISEVNGLSARLSGIDTYAANLTSTKAEQSQVNLINGQITQINAEIANRATLQQVNALVAGSGNADSTAYSKAVTDFKLSQKPNTTDVNASLTLKTDVTRSRRIVTPQAFGGKAQANFDNTAAVNAALADLNANGGGTLYYPPGRYVQGSIHIPGPRITVTSDPNSVTTVRTTQRGPAFWWAADNVNVSGLIINSDSALFEGPIYFSGSNCLISRVQGLYGDATSFVVSGKVFNGGGATMTTNNNRVEFCYAKGQKRYHDVAGTSPFIAGDYATNTTFYGDVVEDCYNADAFDSDNSNGTIFENCLAKSNGSLTGLTAFWCEGEQADNDHTAKFINCTAINYLNAFAAGERAKAIITGGQAISCTRAFQGLNNVFRAYVTGVTATSCGTGTSTLTEGIFMSYGPVSFKDNVTTASATGVNSYCNYSGSALNDVFKVEGGIVDRNIRVAYSTGGLQFVELSNIRLLAGASLIYTDGQNHTLTTNSLTFDDGAIIGSRIKRAIHRNAKFTSTDASRTHLNLLTDNFNTYVENSEFNGGTQVAVAGTASFGPGIRTYSVTTPPSAPESKYVQGDTRTSRTTLTTTPDTETPSGFYNVSGTYSGLTSTIGNFLLMRTHHESAAGTGGPWMLDIASDMNTGALYTRSRFDDGRAWGAINRILTIPVSGLASGDLFYYNGTNLVRIPAGTNGQFLKMVSGLPAWSN